jgi:hypothetical protein
MLNPRRLALAFLSLACLATAETRFGRPVAKLANPKEFEFVSLDDSKFPLLHKNSTSVACIAYRELQRYYVEVAVSNSSGQPIVLDKDFVQFKAEAGIQSLDTVAVAADVEKSAAAPAQPGLSASRASSVSAGLITSGDDRNQPLAEAMARSAQQHAAQLSARLKAYGHERQSLTIEAGNTRVYVFVFEAQGRKKAPFEVSVATPSDPLVFAFKE